MKNLCNNRKTEQHAENVSGSGVKGGFKVERSNAVKSLELIQSGSSNRGGNTGVATRTFSGTDHAAVINSHATNFIGMNRSAVVSARSLRGKSMDFCATDAMNHIHRETSINILHLMPTNDEALQGINNQQTFISKNYFRMNENQVENGAHNQSPSQGAKGVCESVINNVYVNQSANCEKGAKSHDVSTTGPKALGVGKTVTHLAIISRQEIVTERRAA